MRTTSELERVMRRELEHLRLDLRLQEARQSRLFGRGSVAGEAGLTALDETPEPFRRVFALEDPRQ